MSVPSESVTIGVSIRPSEPDAAIGVSRKGRSWNGHLIRRMNLSASKELLAEAGVYILWSEPDADDSDPSALPRAYVGKSGNASERLSGQDKKKDWWGSAVIFVDPDNLNTAHVEWLEGQLIRRLFEAGRTIPDNRNSPSEPKLGSDDLHYAQELLEDILVALRAINVRFFELPYAPLEQTADLMLRKDGKEIGRLARVGQDFVVREGSRAAGHEMASCPSGVKDWRRRLIKQGVLVQQGDSYVFSRDFAFPRSSPAASVLLGYSANGRVEWKDAHGRTLKELEATDPA